MRKIDYKEWKDTLKQYKAEMTKELAEVRKAKQELYEMQRQLQEMAFSGRYERDEDTLVLSAPNIIIGNVDKHGNLLSGNSNIIIRGHNVALDGVGESDGTSVTGGQVVTRARTVKVQTVDPGPDGLESVAFMDSSFSVQSAAIGMSAETVDGNANGGVFTRSAKNSTGNIELSAETNVNVTASVPLLAKPAGTTTPLDTAISKLNDITKDNSDTNKKIEDTIKNVGTEIDKLDKNQNNKNLDLLGKAGEQADTLALRTGLYKFDERTDISEIGSMNIAQGVVECSALFAHLAEANRVQKYLTDHKTKLNANADNKLNAGVNITSGIINLKTADSKGEILTAEGNGVNIITQNTKFEAVNGTTPIEKTTFKVVADDVNFDASKYEYTAIGSGADEKIVPSKGVASGSLKFNAFQIEMKTMDREYDTADSSRKIKSEKIHEKSRFWLNTEEASFDMADSEGKTSGKFKVNAKEIDLTGYDFKKEGGIAEKVTEGSMIKVGAETMILGTVLKDKLECKHIQLYGNMSHVFGKEKLFVHQDKVGLSFKDNEKATIIGKEIKLGGAITLSGDTEVKGALTAGDIDAKNVTASVSVTGPNYKDGVPVASGPAASETSDAPEPTTVQEDVVVKPQDQAEGGDSAAS